ncbi:MAG: hypothetical protein V1776_00890 [Candidatus Diapherotrites archaeon]
MNRKIIILGFLLMAMMVASSMVVAQSNSATNQGQGNTAEVQKTKLASVLTIATQNQNSKAVRFNSGSITNIREKLMVSNSDAERLIAMGITKSELESLNATEKEAFLQRLRQQINAEKLAAFRTRVANLHNHNDFVLNVLATKKIEDSKTRAVARLRIAEEIADSETRPSLTALRARLENASTINSADEEEVDQELLELRQRHILQKTESAVEKANAISDKLGTFILRLTNKYDDELEDSGAAMPRLRLAIEKLTVLNDQLDESIAKVLSSKELVQSDTATHAEIRELHRELVKMKVYANQSVNAIRAIIRWINAHQNGQTVSEDAIAAIESAIIPLSAEEVSIEVEEVLSETEITEVTDESDDNGGDDE